MNKRMINTTARKAVLFSFFKSHVGNAIPTFTELGPSGLLYFRHVYLVFSSVRHS